MYRYSVERNEKMPGLPLSEKGREEKGGSRRAFCISAPPGAEPESELTPYLLLYFKGLQSP
jgi:hypothetical protein